MTLFTPETQQQTPTETMGRGLKRGSFEPFVSATKRPRVSEPPQVFPGASKMQKTNTGAATTPSAGNGFGYSSNNSFGFNGGNNGSIFNNNNFNGNGNGFTFQQAQQNGSGVPGISPVQRKRRANDLDSMAQPGNMMTPEAAMAAPDGSLPTKRARMDPEAFLPQAATAANKNTGFMPMSSEQEVSMSDVTGPEDWDLSQLQMVPYKNPNGKEPSMAKMRSTVQFPRICDGEVCNSANFHPSDLQMVPYRPGGGGRGDNRAGAMVPYYHPSSYEHQPYSSMYGPARPSPQIEFISEEDGDANHPQYTQDQNSEDGDNDGDVQMM